MAKFMSYLYLLFFTAMFVCIVILFGTTLLLNLAGFLYFKYLHHRIYKQPPQISEEDGKPIDGELARKPVKARLKSLDAFRG